MNTASSVEYFLREAFRSLWRNAFMTIASVATMALSLIMLGMFILIGLNLNHMANQVESTVEISVYLKDDISEEEFQSLEEQLKGLQGVQELTYMNKDQALERFKERLGDRKDLLDALGGENPLPASFQIRVETPEQVEPIVLATTEMVGVDDTQFGQEIIEQIFSVARWMRIISLVLVFFLGLAALFIIANTIRVAVFARRREISIMKYVGATDGFIRLPFFLEGIILGLMGAVVATIVIDLIYSLFSDQLATTLTFLPILPKYPLLLWTSIGMVILGPAIGALGSMISIKRFLKV